MLRSNTYRNSGHMAQLVARFPCKEEVIGSIPVASNEIFLYQVFLCFC